MLKKERQALILREVNIHNKVLLSDLSEQFHVSEDTVRRDLQELADADKVIKVRGGALSKSYHVYRYKEQDIYAYQEKTVIAQKAISLLRDDMLVLMSGGSTNREVARILPPELRLTVLTPSLSTATQLSEHPNVDTVFLGGRLSKTAKISIGAEVVEQLSGIRADLCLLGTNGLDINTGITDSDWDVVAVKRALVRAASRTAVLTITEKLGTIQKVQVCRINDIDLLITELDPAHEILKPYQQSGVKVV